MSKAKKRLKKLRNNPKSVSFQDAESVLLSLGFELKRIQGSHHIYTIEIDGVTSLLTIPYKRPHIGRIYVKQILALIDELGLDEASTEENDDKQNS